MNLYLFAGAILGFFSLVMGAYCDHVLKPMIDIHSLEMMMTAIRYQQFHAVIIAAIGLSLYGEIPATLQKYLKLAALTFLCGTVFFSFSIYLAVIFNIHGILNMTPSGGVILMIGWLLLAFGAVINYKIRV